MAGGIGSLNGPWVLLTKIVLGIALPAVGGGAWWMWQIDVRVADNASQIAQHEQRMDGLVTQTDFAAALAQSLEQRKTLAEGMAALKAGQDKIGDRIDVNYERLISRIEKAIEAVHEVKGRVAAVEQQVRQGHKP